MLATEYLLVDISLINSARSDVSQLNKHNLALEPACLASPKLRKGARSRYTISYLTLISNCSLSETPGSCKQP